MPIIQNIKNKYPLIFSIALVLLGVFLFLNFYFQRSPGFAMALFIIATISMWITIEVWRSFAPTYAPKIIFWTTSHKYARKLIAGGSFTYYEYKENIDKIGKFEPISRFINLMIAFLGLTTTIAKTINFLPESPVESADTMITWSIFLLFVPLILTPIIPIIYVMEDLKLKAWNEKTFENWRVSVRYKKRFNSFISIGAISVGLGLNQTSPDLMTNITTFLGIILNGVILLVYPVSILTLLYYLLFRETVNKEVRETMNIKTAKTILQVVDPQTGLSLEEMEKIKAEELAKQKDEVKDVQSSNEKPMKFHKKLGANTKKTFMSLNDNTFGRVGRLIKKEPPKKEKTEPSEINEKDTTTKRKGGSATKGLWD
ncbi:MAG: hypothetical protein INQ03_15080 [Candidatus Heimdallarchaeota archaeon]|nr:hypothetical protein [Candidatus Heimdallarchaeota archaeon]